MKTKKTAMNKVEETREVKNTTKVENKNKQKITLTLDEIKESVKTYGFEVQVEDEIIKFVTNGKVIVKGLFSNGKTILPDGHKVRSLKMLKYVLNKKLKEALSEQLTTYFEKIATETGLKLKIYFPKVKLENEFIEIKFNYRNLASIRIIKDNEHNIQIIKKITDYISEK